MSLGSLLNAFEGFTEFHETVGDFDVGGFVESGLDRVKAMKAKLDYVFDYHRVVPASEQGLKIFYFFWVVVHRLNLRFICDSLSNLLIN